MSKDVAAAGLDERYRRLAAPTQGKLTARVTRLLPALLVIAVHIAGLWLISRAGIAVPAVTVPPPAVLVAFLTQSAPPVPVSVPVPSPVPVRQLAPVRPQPPVVPHVAATAAPNAPQESHAVSTPSPAIAAAPAPQPPIAEPPPAAPPAAPPLISSGVAYLRAPEPQYPSAARRHGDEGEVVFRVLINAAGEVEQVEKQRSSGFASLDEAGRQAILKAVFKPYLEQGKARAAYVLVPIKFQLKI